MSEHFKSQERELEQLHHQWDRDLEKLRAKNKSELENRVCLYAYYMYLCSYTRRRVSTSLPCPAHYVLISDHFDNFYVCYAVGSVDKCLQQTADLPNFKLPIK